MKKSRTSKINAIKAKFHFHSAMAESALVRESLGDKPAGKDADFHFAEKWKIYWRIKRFCPGLAWVFE